MDRATIAEAITITLKLLCFSLSQHPPQSPKISSSQFQYFPLSQVSPGLCFPSFTPFLAPAFVPAYGICSLEPGLSGQVINMDIFRFSSTVETCTRGQTQAMIWADPTRNQERERELQMPLHNPLIPLW